MIVTKMMRLFTFGILFISLFYFTGSPAKADTSEHTCFLLKQLMRNVVFELNYNLTELLAKAEKEQDNATKEIDQLINQHEDSTYLIVQLELQDSKRNIKAAKDFLNKAKDKAAYLTTIDCELWCGDLYEYPYESALQVLQDIRSAVEALLRAERNLQKVLAIIAENNSLDWGKLESYSYEARIWVMTSKLVADRTEKMLEKELRLLEPGFLCQDQGKDGAQ